MKIKWDEMDLLNQVAWIMLVGGAIGLLLSFLITRVFG